MRTMDDGEGDEVVLRWRIELIEYEKALVVLGCRVEVGNLNGAPL